MLKKKVVTGLPVFIHATHYLIDHIKPTPLSFSALVMSKYYPDIPAAFLPYT